MKLLIKNGRVIDPSSRTDETLDILIVQGKIADIKTQIGESADRIIDASRLVVAPGFIDMHVHLREPGGEDKETILTGSRAAARGGFTTICCMPNTNPVNDHRSVTQSILSSIRKTALVNVLPIAAVTKGQKSECLTDLEDLAQAGAVAFSDDGRPVADSFLMRSALQRTRALGSLIIDHCEERSLTQDGCMNEGAVSRRLGFKGMPAAAEEIMVSRDIILAESTGAPVHIAHLSVKGALRAVKEAKERGVSVTAEATPHHLVLNDSFLEKGDTNFKMNPPLRGQEDVEALLKGVQNGIVDVIVTDHAPHTDRDKSEFFDKAPFGIVGLETAVSVLLDRLVNRNLLSLPRFVELFSFNPARVLGLRSKGRIAVGMDADLTILNLHKEIIVDKNQFESKSRNTPFHGWKLKGCPVTAIVGGTVVFPFEPLPPPSADGA